MKDPKKPIYNKLVFSAIILALILLMQPLEILFFIKDIDVLFPSGIIALKERNLLIFIQLLMLLIIIPVYIFTFAFSWWYRADNKEAKYDPHLVDHKIAEIAWWGVPLILTAIVAFITYVKTHELDPYKPISAGKKPIHIEVVALQWKWLFIYPEEQIATVNQLKFPSNTPIQFDITADAPMNSFWIPKLGGQIYAMPGMKTTLHLIANEEGTFRGSSANISGKGFAGMTFETEATSEESYEEWVQSIKDSSKTLNLEEYKTLAAPSENNPVELFQLQEENLFHEIIMKYMKPPSKP
ncbi:MAG: ubiquinol oxidase subunit II [Chlamydiota bacterium]|nr:ubiquinol oxidase subunit II [Chlamydiota bacterium]